LPFFATKFKSSINLESLLYENATFSSVISPLTFLISIALGFKTTSSSSRRANILSAQAREFCNSVITVEISLKGFVY